MDKVKKGKIYALIAAILFAVYTILSFYIRGRRVIDYLEYFFEFEISVRLLYYIIFDVLFCISFVLITVALFCKSKKFLIVGVAANALLNMIQYIADMLKGGRYSFHHIIFILTIAAYAVLIFLVVQSLRKSDQIVKMIWFLPSLIILIYNTMYYVIHESNFYGVIISVENIAVIIAEVLALFFIGFWLKVSAPSAPVKADTPLLGGADKLKEYKRLLDSGEISKDEFDEKKRQILNL